MMNVFDRINEYIETMESSVVTLATTLIPWLTPLLPAWLTFYHLKTIPGITPFIAATTGISVELFGLAAISTLFSLMRHNKENKAEKRKVTLSFPVIAYVFYIFVIVTVNVLMEIPFSSTVHQYVAILAIALLTLMSTPSFIITVSRLEQREIEEKTRQGKLLKVSEISETSQIHTDWRKLPFDDKKVVYSLTVDEIQKIYKRSERTARNWKKNAEEEFKNGVL